MMPEGNSCKILRSILFFSWIIFLDAKLSSDSLSQLTMIHQAMMQQLSELAILSTRSWKFESIDELMLLITKTMNSVQTIQYFAFLKINTQIMMFERKTSQRHMSAMYFGGSQKTFTKLMRMLLHIIRMPIDLM